MKHTQPKQVELVLTKDEVISLINDNFKANLSQEELSNANIHISIKEANQGDIFRHSQEMKDIIMNLEYNNNIPNNVWNKITRIKEIFKNK